MQPLDKKKRPLVKNADCHFLAALTALVQSILEGRTDCPISGVFGAVKTRAAAEMIGACLLWTHSRSWGSLKKMQYTCLYIFGRSGTDLFTAALALFSIVFLRTHTEGPYLTIGLRGGVLLVLLFWVGLLLVSFFWGNLISITCLFQLLTDHVSH